MDVKDTKNRRLVSDIVIDEDQYKNLLNMLNSTEQDAVVALNVINNLKVDKNLIQVLFLRKESACSNDYWNIHCSKHIKYHKNTSVITNPNLITYANIFKILNQFTFSSKKDKEQALIFYTKRLENFLIKNLLGFEDVIDNFSINVKIKDNDK